MIGKPSDDAGCFSFDMAFRISLVPALETFLEIQDSYPSLRVGPGRDQ